MLPAKIHSYLLWRAQVRPAAEVLAARRVTTAISLLPAAVVGIFVFGWYAGLVVVASLISAWLADWAGRRWILKAGRAEADSASTRMFVETARRDGVWLLTGLLIGLLLPPAVPLWIPILGAAAAVLVGKFWLAVDGMPLLQPAALGVLLLHAAFFGTMQTKEWPVLARQVDESAAATSAGSAVQRFLGGDIRKSVPVEQYRRELFGGGRPAAEAVSKPRPLDVVKAQPGKPALEADGPARYGTLDLLLGYVPGTIGSGTPALLLGILLLVFSGAVVWLQPLAAMVTMAAGLFLLSWLKGDVVQPANIPIHLLSGATLLGVFYLAADPVVAPRSRAGKLLSGVTVGVLEVGFRLATPLSVAFFITVPVVQVMAPLFDKFLPPRADEDEEQPDALAGGAELEGADFFAAPAPPSAP